MQLTGDWHIDLITLAIVVISLITALIGLFTAFRTSRKAQAKIEEIHVSVNSNLAAVVARVDQLTDALNNAGVDVPVDPKNP